MEKKGRLVNVICFFLCCLYKRMIRAERNEGSMEETELLERKEGSEHVKRRRFRRKAPSPLQGDTVTADHHDDDFETI